MVAINLHVELTNRDLAAQYGALAGVRLLGSALLGSVPEIKRSGCALSWLPLLRLATRSPNLDVNITEYRSAPIVV